MNNSKHNRSKQVIGVAFLACLLIIEQSGQLQVAASLLNSGKLTNFDTPPNEKISALDSANQANSETTGQDNNTNNVQTTTSTTEQASSETNSGTTNQSFVMPKEIYQKSALLKPLTLNENDSSENQDDSAASVLKSTVSTNNFVPVDSKTQTTELSKPTSIFSRKKKKTETIIEQAQKVSAMPLPLIESSEETDKKIDTIIDSERQELAQLWEATLTRSPDIQFVLQKLMPGNNNVNHATTILMRMLSTAMFGAMGAVTMMSPSIGTYAASSMGGSMVMNLLQLQEGKNAKKARLTQTESIMLYSMIRANADRLVDCFRNYKKNLVSLDRANTDFEDLQSMVSDTRSIQNSGKQLEAEYTIRKSKRDIEALTEEVRRYRQNLVDLAGPDAVAKLDKQITEEQLALKNTSCVDPEKIRTASAASPL